MARILVADDEKDILEIVRHNLALEGHEVMEALSGRGALELALSAGPDLLILDVMLPDLQGFEVLRRIRKSPATARLPVIMLTARRTEQDLLIGFELGADDYVMKPFSPRELLARVRAVLGRAHPATTEETPQAAPDICFGRLRISREARQVFVDGTEAALAPQEYRLLLYMALRPMKALTRDRLIEGAWGNNLHIDHRTVDVHIRRLRARIEADPAHPKILETVRGGGYRFNPGAGETGD